MPQNRNQSFRRVISAAFIAHLILALWFIERGLLNADEGWYLYAARQIAHGLEPHQDFAFFQVSVYPRVMAGLLESGAGSLITARWISGFMLAAATVTATLAAARLTNTAGAVIVAVTMGLHPLVVSTGVLAKPYALTLLLVSVGLFLLSGRDRVRVALGFMLFGVAVGTRLSLAVPVLPLLWGHRKTHGSAAVAGLLMGVCIAFWPVLGVDLEILWSHWVGVHTAGGGQLMPRLSWLAWQASIGLVMLTLFLPSPHAERMPGLRLAAGLGVLIHLVPSAVHIEHTVVLAPLLSLALADRWSSSLDVRKLCIGVVLFAVSGVSASRWVHLDREISTVEQTTELAAWLRSHTPEDQPILTQQLALAVEADRSVPSGFEMGRFGWSPELSSSDAEYLHHLNSALLQDRLGAPLGAVVLAEGDLDEKNRWAVIQAARGQFGQHRRVERYGQFGEVLNIWVAGEVQLWTE